MTMFLVKKNLGIFIIQDVVTFFNMMNDIFYKRYCTGSLEILMTAG